MLEKEEPRVAEMLMISGLASLLDDEILHEALCGLERPSDLDGVKTVAVWLYSKK